MDPFAGHPFNFNVYFGMKAVREVWDWVTGGDHISVTPAAKTIADNIKYQYNIPVVIATEDSTRINHATDYNCKAIPEEEQARKLAELEKELSKVPVSYLKSIAVKQITICKELEMDDGFSTHALSGYTDIARHDMFLSGIWCFHHELFHQRYANDTCAIWPDGENWLKLDPETPSNIDPKEDQAEYARMLFNQDTEGGRAKHDALMQKPGPQAKFQLMKQWLHRDSKGKIDDQYWTDLRAGKVDLYYWR